MSDFHKGQIAHLYGRSKLEGVVKRVLLGETTRSSVCTADLLGEFCGYIGVGVGCVCVLPSMLRPRNLEKAPKN